MARSVTPAAGHDTPRGWYLACGSPHRTLSLTPYSLLQQSDPAMERAHLLPHVPPSCAAAGSPATPAAHAPASHSPLGSWPAPAQGGSGAAPGSGLGSLRPSPGCGAGSAAGARPPWRPGGGAPATRAAALPKPCCWGIPARCFKHKGRSTAGTHCLALLLAKCLKYVSRNFCV